MPGKENMILDTLPNSHLYHGLHQRLPRAFQFLKDSNLQMMEPGRYEINGQDIYAIVISCDTKHQSESVWEAHRKYIDIQYLVGGAEKMGYANLETLTVTKEYSAEDDCLLLSGDGDFFLVKPGQFVVFMPQDAHMPGLAAPTPQLVKKVVVKIAVS